MNSQQARKFIGQYPSAKSFVKPSHLEELSPLLEVHIEAITVRKDEFHELEGGKTYMPRKETLDKFAAAAGVSYVALDGATRKEDENCYVGRSQAMVMGPDGKMVLGDVCEYEFDAGIRLEEMKLNGKADWDHKDEYGRPGKKDYTPAELAKERIQLLKVARQRANTGARSRATLSVLGMQTGFKGLFQKNDKDDKSVTFLFSRIIVNAKNELVMNRMLDNLGPNTAMLYGAQSTTKAIPGSAPPPTGEPEFRNVTPPSGADDFDDVPFGDEPTVDPRLSAIIAALSDWTNVADERIASRAHALLDSGDTRLTVLEPALEILKYLSQFQPGDKVRGGSECVTALDMKPLDPIVLASLATKVRGLQQGAA